MCPRANATACAPGEHEVRLATSADGGNFTLLGNATALGSGTPEVVRRGDTLYVYNDAVVHRYDVANGSWRAPANVSVTNATGAPQRFLNASAIVDPEGRITLFYLFAREGQDAGCGEFPACTKTFRSATEVPGSDGAAFTLDSGNRALVSTSSTASDPEIFAHPGGFVLLVSVGGGVRTYASADLRGTYEFRAFLTNSSGHTPAGHYDAASARYWVYVQQGGQAPDGPPGVIRRAILADVMVPAPDEAFAALLGASTFVDAAGYGFGAPSFAAKTL